MNLLGRRVLITGGSSGIGFELAAVLLERGAHVLITGRKASKVEQAIAELSPKGPVAGLAADLTTAEGRLLTLDTALGTLGGLDILVNNAGGVRAGRLENIEEADVLAMISVNLTGPILLTRAAIGALRQSGDALVVNVSSAIAQVALPFYATYAAVKAGIAHFGESLRRELDGEGIRVLTVYPTATATPMMATAAVSSIDFESPADVARETIEAILSNELEVIRGGPERLALIQRNRSDPKSVDMTMLGRKDALANRAREHVAL